MLPRFYECGGCGHYHPYGWTGDCRDDSKRFTDARLEDQYGVMGVGWIEVDEESGKPI